MRKIIIAFLLIINCFFGFSKNSKVSIKTELVHVKGDVYKINGEKKIKLEKEVEFDEEDKIEIGKSSSITILVEKNKIKISYGKGKLKDFILN